MNAITRSFARSVARIGEFRLRPMSLSEDAALIHSWVSRDYAKYWGLVGRSLSEVREAYQVIARDADVFIGLCDGVPAFLLECYDPSAHAIGQHYRVEPGDRGMHVLVAPTEKPIAGFTWAVFEAVVAFIFSDPAVARIVVEPDVRNEKIHALNRRAGFRYQRLVVLPNKTGHLAFCSRADYLAAIEPAAPPPRAAAREGFGPQTWALVNAQLLRKAIAEFSHERLLQPQLVAGANGEGEFVLTASPDVRYSFRATVLSLEHWQVAPCSLQKTVRGAPAALDAMDFVIEFAERLGISNGNLPVYLEEIASTLYAAAYKHEHERLTAGDLVHGTFQEIESGMSEGHPAFVANSGRVGFDANDHRLYAPEVGAPVRLLWLAARRTRARFSSSAGLSYERLLTEELGAEAIARFGDALTGQGLAPADYLFVPVHPWQWYEKLALSFASDIALRDLVLLGESEDSYQAQQSIRTFFNVSAPRRCYVKTALSVLNMGFMRGLSADYMEGTPAINDWVFELIAGDTYFAKRRFRVLREVAGIGYRKAAFEAALPNSTPYRKMLAALFRESPVAYLESGERLLTMAALLHRDQSGTALLPQLIGASGLDIEAWLRGYLDCYLGPLLHCLYRHDLAFMPHGENVILVLKRNAPVGVWLKDIGEEVAIMNPTSRVPPRVQRAVIAVPEQMRSLCIFTDVFDGFFRFLAALLVTDAAYPESEFWRLVAECVEAYQAEHPELAGRYDLFSPTFAHSCLNRLQLRNNRQMLDLSDPVAGLAIVGSLENPIARFHTTHGGDSPRNRCGSVATTGPS